MLNNFLFEQFPLVLLKYFFPNNIMGFFSAAKGLMNRIQLMPDTFSNILFPFTATSEENVAIRRTNTLCRNFLIIMGGVVPILALTVKPIITLRYGEAFLQATTVCYALLPAIFILPLFRFLNVHIAASGKSKLASLIGFFVYVRFTGTKLWDVVIPVKSDWVYWQRFFNIVALKLRHKSDTGQA